MADYWIILFIGISLSMDAFSLALVYGMTGISNKNKIILSVIVGIYHFIMPLIGLFFGTLIDQISFINLHIIAAIILIYIGIDLIISNFREEEKLSISLIGFLMFGLSVSIDSLTVGIGLRAITNSYFMASFVFSIASFVFTYLGLVFGNVLGEKIGGYSKIVGGIVLIIIAIVMLIS